MRVVRTIAREWLSDFPKIGQKKIKKNSQKVRPLGVCTHTFFRGYLQLALRAFIRKSVWADCSFRSVEGRRQGVAVVYL